MPFTETVLGRTGLEVCRLGVSASFGVPAAAVERAFDQGVNYLYWGSIRRKPFGEALRRLASSKRGKMVVVLQSYSRMASLVGWSIERALRSAGLEYADVLLLGMWNKPVPPGILEASLKLKERGLVRFLAVSTHKRTTAPGIAAHHDFDIVHFRYNAVHAGAERDIFPHLAGDRPGMVAFTATSWRQLLNPKKTPKGEKTPTSTDCYRFVLTRPEVDVCMSGPATSAHMDQALEALRLGPMNDDELAWMRRVGAAIYGH